MVETQEEIPGKKEEEESRDKNVFKMLSSMFAFSNTNIIHGIIGGGNLNGVVDMETKLCSRICYVSLQFYYSRKQNSHNFATK